MGVGYRDGPIWHVKDRLRPYETRVSLKRASVLGISLPLLLSAFPHAASPVKPGLGPCRRAESRPTTPCVSRILEKTVRGQPN
jgi:hypothetical protein